MNMTITESDKKLLSFLVAFLLIVLFVFLVFRPLLAKNEELEREITTTKDQEVAMDMSASLADDMEKKELNTQARMQQVLQRFYPMLQSQEAENMITVLMLNHNLSVQNLSIMMMEKPSELRWYQYSANGSAEVWQESEETQEAQAAGGMTSYGVYTARITCTAEGAKEDLMALVDDISMNYPAISIVATEWAVMEESAEAQMPVASKVNETEDAANAEKTEDAETVNETEDTEAVNETKDAEDEATEEAEEVKPKRVVSTSEQTGSLTISLEIYMCEQ